MKCSQIISKKWRFEIEHFEVGRSGSLIIFYPEGKSPLRGYIRIADTSRRDLSTTWIGPQSGYVPTGFVHYVDWSAERIHPIGIRPLRGLVRKADLSPRDWSTSWIGPQSGFVPKGFVHYVDRSAKRKCPNGIGPFVFRKLGELNLTAGF